MKYSKVEIDKLSASELLNKLLASTSDAFVKDKFQNQRAVFDSFNNLEKVVYITGEFEFEYYNGGLIQFFINSSGQFSENAIIAYKIIGATKTAAVIEQALIILSRYGTNSALLNQKLQDSAEEYKIISQKEIYDDEKLYTDFALLQDELDSFYPTENEGDIGFLLERFIDIHRFELIEEVTPPTIG